MALFSFKAFFGRAKAHDTGLDRIDTRN